MALNLGGGMALAAMLAFSSAGVTAARADSREPEPIAAPTPAGRVDSAEAEMCRVDDRTGVGASRARIAGQISERLHQELQAAGGQVVVLNGRGYNYGR